MPTRKRLAAAWLVGTLVIDILGALSHLLLLKGEGFSRMPDEPRVVAALQASLVADGLYLFPHAFLAAQCVDMVVGWSLTGAAIAGVISGSRPR